MISFKRSFNDPFNDHLTICLPGVVCGRSRQREGLAGGRPCRRAAGAAAGAPSKSRPGMARSVIRLCPPPCARRSPRGPVWFGAAQAAPLLADPLQNAAAAYTNLGIGPAFLHCQYIKYVMTETGTSQQKPGAGAGQKDGGPAHPGGGPPASPRRQPWRFRAHARRLGIPDTVSGHLLDAIGKGTDVPSMLRRAALIGADGGLNPDGLAAQVRKLLAWDYKRHPGDYASNPKDEPIPARQNNRRGGHGAGAGCCAGSDGDRSAPPDAARMHLDWIAERKWAASCYRHGHVLPGHGTSYDRCGKYFTHGCLDHADGSRRSRHARWRCGRLSCPVCCESAIRMGAARGARRMAARAIHRKSPLSTERRHFMHHHVVVSVDPSHYGQLETPEGGGTVPEGRVQADEVAGLPGRGGHLPPMEL